MTMQESSRDKEFDAIQTVYAALSALDETARGRVLDYVSDRLGLVRSGARAKSAAAASESELEEEDVAEPAARNVGTFSAFAELFDAARPKSQSDKALLAGYWLQVCQGAESFDGFSANKELKNLGEGVPNITSALDVLKGQKPALALQLKKAGKSRQARKTYKVTVAGIKNVESMIGG